jgi:uncharacterized protein
MTTPRRFLADVLENRCNRAILERWQALDLPDAWLVAGCLFQTVWNLRAGLHPEWGIEDYDLFYFDARDVSQAGERRVQAKVEGVLGDLGVRVEASNQARVHLWYESTFSHPWPALRDTRDGIDRFLVPCTCVGVRPFDAAQDTLCELYAPNGLEMLYDGELTMNPLTPHRLLFDKKAASYQRRWPWLRIGDNTCLSA